MRGALASTRVGIMQAFGLGSRFVRERTGWGARFFEKTGCFFAQVHFSSCDDFATCYAHQMFLPPLLSETP